MSSSEIKDIRDPLSQMGITTDKLAPSSGERIEKLQGEVAELRKRVAGLERALFGPDIQIVTTE